MVTTSRKHFESLARVRANSGRQIFALEHPLNNTEIAELSSLLRAHLQTNGSLSPYWLPWVIYASERGYTYTGDEYWPSFEEQTPRWEVGDRHKLARYFRQFQRAFGGVAPSGRWADHFTIISWPITHAILPRYLQRQFARVLYELRYSLVSLETRTSTDVGRMLAANAHHTSARFQEFLQQENLTGQIALALLDVAPSMGEELIYGHTLQRIIKDLEEVRSAREWLREVRRLVKDRFKGIGDGPAGRTGVTRQPMAQTELLIRPNIVLGYRGQGIWSARVEIPSFRKVSTRSAAIQAFLMHTRCRLNGADDVKPAGWLLSGNRRGILRRWPDTDKPLIQFDQAYGDLDYLLEAECRLTRGPIWLFKVSDDGTAREIVGFVVRPDCNYIVVTTGELPEPSVQMSDCRVDCIGISSFRLAIPSNVSAEDTAWLGRLGLQVARTIRVWPAGLSGRGWDGEGRSEWLTTEEPCFGIMHDHPVEEYLLCLDNGVETSVKAGDPEAPVFVRIAPLPVGTHTLTVNARRSAPLESVVSTPAAEGFVQLHVREPEPWTLGSVSHTGLLATLDPHDADLDSLWQNEVALSVLGPENHSVAITVSLDDKTGQTILSKQLDRNIALPITPVVWNKTFSRFLEQEEKKNAWIYLEATSGQLDIKGEELGEFSFRFEHDTLPLRWALRRDHDDIAVRLMDDTGEENSQPEVRFFSMGRPLKAERLPSDTASHWKVVGPGGGLFYAKQGDHSDAVIVSANRRVDGLKELSIKPDYGDLRRRLIGLRYSLRLYSRWRQSRVYGPFINVWRKRILKGFLHTFYGRLCGGNWTAAEAAFLNAPKSQHALDALQSAVERRFSGFAASLCRQYTEMDDDLVRASQWYWSVAARYNVSNNQRLCDFALKLASQPHQLPDQFGSDLDGMLDSIRSNPAILRGARLLMILRSTDGDDRSGRSLVR